MDARLEPASPSPSAAVCAVLKLAAESQRVASNVLAIVLALVAAALNACASVLQRRAGADEPDERAFSIQLLLNLVTKPVWLAGAAAMLLGFLVQATALTLGDIALVQPLLIAERWLIGIAVTLGLAGALVTIGYYSRGPRRAGWLGIATGVVFGFTAVLVAGVGAAYRNGLIGVLTAWQTWALVILGPLSFFLLQNALQAGDLVASQPGMTLADPVVAVVWGLTVFGEHARGGPWLVGTFLGAGLLIVGTLVLVRSPLLHNESTRGGRRSEQPSQSCAAAHQHLTEW
jgi:drug/metabolite transporter (DMT)-like permease